MATIATQISELAGTTAAVTSLNDFAAAAINKLTMLLPREVLDPFTSTESETYSATAITTKDKRIFDVYRAPAAGSALNRRCELMDPGEYTGELAHSASMYYPTDYDPRWAAVGDAVRVLPSVASMVITVRKIALLTTFDTTGSSITTLPQECEQLVVLDSAAMVCANKLQALLMTSLTDSIVPPVAPTLATVSYSNASGSTVTAINIGVVPSAPIYTAITIPTGIATVLSLYDTAVTADTLSVTTIADFALTSVAPVISAGLATALTAFDTAMTNEDIELANQQIAKSVQYLQQYQSDLALYNQKVKAEIDTFQANTGKKLEVTKTKILVNVELPKVFLSKAATYLQQYQTQVQESLQSFSKDLEKYKADVQKILEQAQLTEQEAQMNAKLATDVAMQNAIQTMQAIAQNNISLINKYQSEIQAYGNKIQVQVGVFSANIQKLVPERDRLLALWSSLKNEYYELLLTQYRINLRGTSNKREN